jgi:competence protein ComEA
MDMIKRLIRDVFGFSGRETNGFLILLPLSVLLVSVAPIYSSWLANRDDDPIDNSRYLDSLVSILNPEKKSVRDTLIASMPDRRKRNFFKFDPNTASIASLQRLGFSKHLSTRIASYRTAGGEFRVKSDLLKIYGIDSSFYKQLYPYIELPEQITFAEKPRPTTTTKKEHVIFDLNTADSVQLSTVRGIGPKLAARILKFRNSLGGFIKHDQLNEVYGLDSTVVRELSKAFFIQKNFEPVKLNVNSASEAELASHPYIRKKIAKAIITYRFQHGSFSSVDEIRKLNILSVEEAERLIPYLKIFD